MSQKFVTQLYKPLDEKVKKYFYSQNCNIVFHDELIPDIVILESNKSLQSLDYIKSFRKTRKGQLLGKNITKVNLSPDIDESLVHKFGYGFGTKIGVIDSGFNQEICGNVEEAIDFTGIGKLSIEPHGSIVISIIKKFAKAAQIYSAKVCHRGDDLEEDRVFNALNWMRQKNVQLINMSIGLPYNCDGTCELARYVNAIAEKCKIIIVAAVGNNSSKTTYCPACSEEAISVGALSEDGVDVAEFSSPGHINSNKPNILAPGYGQIISKVYVSGFSGTSFAAPVVTGILGALVSYTSNVEKLRIKLLETAEKLEGISVTKQGLGRLNLPKLLEVLENENKIDITGTTN